MSEKPISQKIIDQARQARAAGACARGLLLPGIPLASDDSLPADFIQLFVADRQDLEELLPAARNGLAPGGILWVTYHKGTSKIKTDINRDSINAYAATIGLTGVAMISIDADWSALRLKPQA